MMLTNVTAKIVSDVTGLDKTSSSALMRILVQQGHAKESGARKNIAANGAEFLVVRGRPSVTFDVDAQALVGAIGQDKATKVADKAAESHAEYTKLLAHAEIAAKNKREANAKANKVKSLEEKLAAIRGEQGETF
jgi:hypothetical protein